MFKEGKANHIVNLNTMDCNGFKERGKLGGNKYTLTCWMHTVLLWMKEYKSRTNKGCCLLWLPFVMLINIKCSKLIWMYVKFDLLKIGLLHQNCTMSMCFDVSVDLSWKIIWEVQPTPSDSHYICRSVKGHSELSLCYNVITWRFLFKSHCSIL